MPSLNDAALDAVLALYCLPPLEKEDNLVHVGMTLSFCADRVRLGDHPTVLRARFKNKTHEQIYQMLFVRTPS